MFTSGGQVGYDRAMKALDRAIQVVGSQDALAKAVGLKSAMAVSQWRRRGVPAKHCPAISAATGGTVSVDDLLQDIFDAGAVKLRGQVSAIRCPNCDSIDVLDHTEFGLPLGHNMRCAVCGHLWSR